ncbi:MAG TPA: ABC transporter ATP-binding protein [Micromonosporaceae bacterium]|nr:ABC transporter ATP-binding protein [Micromonosporaceae bacterium]
MFDDLSNGGVEINLVNVTKQYPGQPEPAVDRVSLRIPAGELVVLVGPSGCGKTTTMKMINRLIESTSGEITIGGENIRALEPDQLRRRIGYVIQQTGLFPHLTIADNIALVPRMLRWNRDRVRKRVDELLDMVGLDPARYRQRYPRQLSGGQQQRVGVARALAADPPVMLMDEPFGATDPVTRERLQNEFLRLQRELRKTIIFVTHDFDEAIKLGDRIAVLREKSHIAQYDSPDRILAAPADDYVASFIGAGARIKRLGLTCVRAVVANGQLNGRSNGSANGRSNGQVLGVGATLPTVSVDASLQEALDVFLATPHDELIAVDQDGAAVGTLSFDMLRSALAPDARKEPV